MHALHQRYGPVVRVGPNELSFASAAAARDIYVGVNTAAATAATGPIDDTAAGDVDADAHLAHDDNSDDDRAGQLSSGAFVARQSEKAKRKGGRPDGSGPQAATTTAATSLRTFPKGALYDFGRPCVSNIRDEAAHRARLRRVGHCFSAALLPDMEPGIRDQLEVLLNALDERRGKVVDMVWWFRMFALDVTGGLTTSHFETPSSTSYPSLQHPLPPMHNLESTFTGSFLCAIPLAAVLTITLS